MLIDIKGMQNLFLSSLSMADMLKLSPKMSEKEKSLGHDSSELAGSAKSKKHTRMLLQIKTLKLFPRFILSLS